MTDTRKFTMARAAKQMWKDPKYRGRVSGAVGATWANNARYRAAITAASTGRLKNGLAPTEHPTNMQIAWTAGIFEGEGCASVSGRNARVAVTRKDPWLLYRCRALFGGTVRHTTLGHQWILYGARARGLLMTIYVFVSPRRKEQIRKALGVSV